MEYQDITLERHPNRVATITINRPKAMNSFTVNMCKEFVQVWKELAEDDSVNAIVLQAAAGRAFCTGKDVRLNENMLGSDNLWNQRDPGEFLGPKANRCWKPVIAAVHGMCGGGAFYFVNESDIVICSEDAQFFDPHVTYGQIASLEPIGLRFRIPLAEVLRIALMGNDERVGAETALRIGLVSEITSNEALAQRAHDIATTIAEKPSVATQGTVKAIWQSLDHGRRAAIETGLKYCQLGNPSGVAQVDRDAIMGKAKSFVVR